MKEKNNFNEYNLILSNLEKLRVSLNIEMQEIDRYAELGTNAYSRFINKKQSIKVEELISISNKIYNLEVVQILNPSLAIPEITDLPPIIVDLIKERIGKLPRTQQKRDIIQYCILILNQHFNVGDDFTNSQIKRYLTNDLELLFKNKSIEWSKSVLSPFIEYTDQTRKAKTRAEKVYKLIKAIPIDMITDAKEAVENSLK